MCAAQDNYSKWRGNVTGSPTTARQNHWRPNRLECVRPIKRPKLKTLINTIGRIISAKFNSGFDSGFCFFCDAKWWIANLCQSYMYNDLITLLFSDHLLFPDCRLKANYALKNLKHNFCVHPNGVDGLVREIALFIGRAAPARKLKLDFFELGKNILRGRCVIERQLFLARNLVPYYTHCKLLKRGWKGKNGEET